MHEEMRFPRNGKESILFLAVISILSVNIIGPLIMGFEFGFSKANYLETLKVLPFIWVCVVLLVVFVAKPLAAFLNQKFVGSTDGVNARVLYSTLFNVTILSVILTIVGSWIGLGTISLEPVQNFFYSWPRNFFIAFWVELLIAQPAARFVMKKLHQRQNTRAAI